LAAPKEGPGLSQEGKERNKRYIKEKEDARKGRVRTDLENQSCIHAAPERGDSCVETEKNIWGKGRKIGARFVGGGKKGGIATSGDFVVTPQVNKNRLGLESRQRSDGGDSGTTG